MRLLVTFELLLSNFWVTLAGSLKSLLSHFFVSLNFGVSESVGHFRITILASTMVENGPSKKTH